MRILGNFAVAVAVALAGCSAGESTDAAKTEVAKFRQQVAAGQFAEIYKAAAPDIRNSISEAKFVEMVGGFHQAIGTFKSAPDPGWGYDTDTNTGQRVTLDYDSVFERGKAHEQFTYRMIDGKPVLAGYDYKADAIAPAPAPSPPVEDDGSDGEGEGT
ncbi:MAG: hypothetical protein EON59_02550 [Alphaproteobacteria bacterium]|nr:MAG: hypothetical protein EON59_02550 [Alphaproteobacteria bacterium]